MSLGGYLLSKGNSLVNRISGCKDISFPKTSLRGSGTDRLYSDLFNYKEDCSRSLLTRALLGLWIFHRLLGGGV